MDVEYAAGSAHFPVQPRDFLLYYYYGGMLYTALKDYNKALDMFQLAFTMPCHGCPFMFLIVI